MAQVSHLSELNEKYYDKGFRILAISSEAPGVLQSKMIDEKGVKYWMAADPSRSTVSRFSEGQIGIPHSYLVDARGKVVGEGVPNEQMIEQLLADTFDEALGRELDRALGTAVKSYEKGQIGAAWSAAQKLLEHEKTEVADDAKFLVEKSEAYAKFMMELVEAGVESKDYVTVIADLGRLVKDFAGMPVAEQAATQKAELEKDPAVKNEIDAADALDKARAKEDDAGGKEKKLKGVLSAYEKIVKKYEGTKAAALAAEAVKRLEAVVGK